MDPALVEITAPNGRRYQSLSRTALIEYYWPYAIAYAGNTYQPFKERESILRKTLFNDDMIFSGQEKGGFVVFPALDDDVEDFEVRIENMILRFDYRDEPMETVDIPYQFTRGGQLCPRAARSGTVGGKSVGTSRVFFVAVRLR